MTKTAVLFVDTTKPLDGATVASARVMDVPLVKRILIDLRRAGIHHIFAVLDERTPEMEAIFDDTRRTNFRRCVFSGDDWRKELLETGDADTLVLTADRLSDHRYLKTFAETRRTATDGVAISVDLKAADHDSPTEKRFTPNDGKLIAADEVLAVPGARDVGIYRLPVAEVAGFEKYDPEYIRGRAEQHKHEARAEYFDIGNGFVELIDSKVSIRRAEQRLIRYIWKSTDGIHGRTNKRMILPLLKVVLRTSVTPNMVSLVGVIVSIMSGYFYFRGHYVYAVVGALLALASSLLDHIDGSIARMKSKESAFGAHFDTVCDYVFYVSFGVGASVGLYKSSGHIIYIWFGISALFGTIMSLVMMSYQRSTRAVDASQYAAEAHQRIDQQGGQNAILKLGKRVYFVARRPALPYYLLFFTATGLLPFVLFMVALGTNLFWMFHVYSNRLLSPHPKNLN